MVHVRSGFDQRLYVVIIALVGGAHQRRQVVAVSLHHRSCVRHALSSHIAKGTQTNLLLAIQNGWVEGSLQQLLQALHGPGDTDRRIYLQ